MSIQDLKLYAVNGAAFTISLTNIEVQLKIMLLVITIGYTVHKWHSLIVKNQKKNDK
jgi:hypothetical protein